MAGTVLPTLTAAQFAARLAALFPNGWAAPEAAQTGNLSGVLNAGGGVLAQVLQALNYGRASILLGTATAPELDLASQDFLGASLPRPAGMSDADFAALIQAHLFPRGATRPAIAAALLTLTGKQPRMLEPWAPADTGAWGSASGSYWGHDSAANPGRWGAPQMRATGFIDSAPPLAKPALNGNPVPAWGAPFYWSRGPGLGTVVPAYGFMILAPAYAGTIPALLETLRAIGVTIEVRITANPQ